MEVVEKQVGTAVDAVGRRNQVVDKLAVLVELESGIKQLVAVVVPVHDEEDHSGTRSDSAVEHGAESHDQVNEPGLAWNAQSCSHGRNVARSEVCWENEGYPWGRGVRESEYEVFLEHSLELYLLLARELPRGAKDKD